MKIQPIVEEVVAHREYEAWFLAALDSLRGKRGIREDASFPSEPEAPRDAKGQLGKRMGTGRSYLATIDQEALTACFSLDLAWRRSCSFRKLSHSFGALLRGVGKDIGVWPPECWRTSTAGRSAQDPSR